MVGELSPGQRRTALASVAAAAVLMALKLGTGLVTGSLALVSAGVESSGDVIAALLTFFAVLSARARPTAVTPTATGAPRTSPRWGRPASSR